MAFRHLNVLPGALFALVLLTFAITYVIAVLLEHVKPAFPYISDTGTDAPESCIFAQLINIAAGLLVLCVYVRYRQIAAVAAAEGTVGLAVSRRVNLVAAAFGSAACLGLDLVANFQEERVLAVHMIGAFLCFFSATVYFCIQTYISKRLMPAVTGRCTFVWRALMSALCIALCVTTIVPAMFALSDYEGDDKKQWTSSDGGWTMHLVSTVSEWLLVVCFCSFIASFSGEFKGVVLHSPLVEVATAPRARPAGKGARQFV